MSIVFDINPYDASITIRCPKLPKDTDARIGVRRDPKNPDRKQKIFGYNLVLSTSVEVHLKIELPVAVTNIAGNAEEGSQIINNKEQIHAYHNCQVKVDIALLLKRAFSFIIRITNQFRKLHQTNDPTIKEKLKPPFIPKSIRNVIQME